MTISQKLAGLRAQEQLQLPVGKQNESISSTLFDQQTQDLVCFSLLRPQQLLNWASRHFRVWFWEEPVWGDKPIDPRSSILVPHVSTGTPPEIVNSLQRRWLNDPFMHYSYE